MCVCVLSTCSRLVVFLFGSTEDIEDELMSSYLHSISCVFLLLLYPFRRISDMNWPTDEKERTLAFGMGVCKCHSSTA